MKCVRQADDPFVCFGTKPDKMFGLEISDATGSRQGNARIRVGWRKPQGSRQSTPESRRDQSAWDRVQKQWGKASQDELAFLVAL